MKNPPLSDDDDADNNNDDNRGIELLINITI